jgi:hypothetical protein
VPANAKLHGRELADIVQNLGACVCFASSELATEIAARALSFWAVSKIVAQDGSS